MAQDRVRWRNMEEINRNMGCIEISMKGHRVRAKR